MLTIHLGAHKTASTHLQQCLRQVREQFEARGLAYLGPTELRSILHLNDAMVGQRRSKAFLLCRRSFHELRAAFAHLLISEENILGGTQRTNMFSSRGMIYPGAAPRLRRLINMAGGGPAEIFLGIRDPASFSVSCFALQVSLGNETRFDEYLRGRDPAGIRWSGLVSRLSSLETVSRIVVWRYEDYADLRPRLLQRLLPGDMAEIVPNSPPANVSISQPGFEWLLERAGGASRTELRDLVQAARRRFSASAGHAPLRLVSDEDMDRSRRLYARDVVRVRRMAKVEFLDPDRGPVPA
ncbi:hypothetical protein [Paracoccus ravus]|uniref:hypothetical protein n=1 Tax=Paracoccus ravus TaxID=2447760 RepID=UPI00106E119F|nr:hypothetical protein [Paracoccus ravus]